MKQISFSKVAIIVCLLCAALLVTITSFAQDTIYCKKVRIRNTIGISMKTGKVLYASHLRRVKVDSGYIIKLKNGMYLINGKERYPSNFRYKALSEKQYAMKNRNIKR
jgi:hypothetical protein